jgi:DNA-binding transcriptional ArsR family regulator
MLQDPSFLLSEPPAVLTERPLSDVRALFWGAAEMDERHFEAVDHLLRDHALRALVQRAPDGELKALDSTIRRLFPKGWAERLGRWAHRWLAYADLLDARRGSLHAQDPERARKLAHAGRVLELVAAEPGLSQTELGERLDLKPANLSRILAVLEANELIERRMEGREKRIRLAVRIAPTAAAGGSQHAKMQRFSSFLTLAHS